MRSIICCPITETMTFSTHHSEVVKYYIDSAFMELRLFLEAKKSRRCLRLLLLIT